MPRLTLHHLLQASGPLVPMTRVVPPGNSMEGPHVALPMAAETSPNSPRAALYTSERVGTHRLPGSSEQSCPREGQTEGDQEPKHWN